ncbi:DUF2062 domain-containing protein [soil metagenome]
MFKRRDKRPLVSRIREALYPRRGWGRAFEYYGHRVKRIPDTPHRIAIGFSCGVVASFTPFFGFHFFIAAGLAWLLRGNIIAGLIGTSFGNPLNFPFIASISLGLGRRILGYGVTGRDFSRVMDALSEGASGLWNTFLALFGIGESAWDRLVPLFIDIMLPWFVGGLLPGLVAAIASYYLTRPLVGAYQGRRRARMIAQARERMHAAKTRADEEAGAAYDAEEQERTGR